MDKLSIRDLGLSGKKVLMRVDFNVPMNKDGTIADDTRIKESLPSIQYILKSGASLILMSHMGRPKGFEPQLSLKPCANALSKLLGKPVAMAEDCVGEKVKQLVHALKPGEILLLENLRFHPAEEKPSLDPSFAKELSKLGDIYVNDAFATAHRSHSSTAIITSYFPGRAAAGLLLQKEMQFLGTLVMNPTSPFHAIIGGSKVSTKMGVLKSLLSKTQSLFIGGGMAFTFFKAQGIKIGNSIFEEDQIPVAKEIIDSCLKNNITLHLPLDLIIADTFSDNANTQLISASKGIPDGWQGMDIGPLTLKEWGEALHKAKTIFWNGPLGVFEFPHFATGTQQIAKTLSSLQSITVIGGGDSVAAINQMGIASKFTHLSTGGGAALEYLEFGHLPGIDALSDKLPINN